MNRRDGDELKVPGSPDEEDFWGRFFLVRSIPTALYSRPYTVKHGTARHRKIMTLRGSLFSTLSRQRRLRISSPRSHLCRIH